MTNGQINSMETEFHQNQSFCIDSRCRSELIYTRACALLQEYQMVKSIAWRLSFIKIEAFVSTVAADLS